MLMKNSTRLLIAFVALVTLATSMFAQGPQPKSQKEVDALMAIQNAATVESRIEAATKLIQDFADTQFKSWALSIIMQSYEMKQDTPNMIVYAEQTLEAKPSAIEAATAHIRIANGLVRQTKEHDLDREEKLKRVEESAKKGIELLATAQKPNPDFPDDQWAGYLKAEEAMAHDSMAQAEFVRKKYVEAAEHFKAAIAAQPDPVRMLKAGNAYRLAKKYDEAIAMFDQAIASPDANDQVKNLAESEKKQAMQGKESGA
jgi:tetratricopeptide (TPR) repeat protein